MLVSGRRPGLAAVAMVLLALVGAQRSADAVAGLRPDRLGPYRGWVTVIDDPQPAASAMRVIVEIEGERFEIWARGRARPQRVARWQAGDMVWVDGTRVALRPDRVGWVAWQHVVGALDADSLGDRRPGAPVARASNQVRSLIARGASAMPPSDAALARGLIIGDDRDQPRSMIERFRRSGLSHLTAVSGQNVAFVLAAAGPMLRRLRPGWRLGSSLALIGWFVVITRAEPSVLRAGVMAGLAAIGFALGRDREPTRLLALAVTGLLLVDPLLVRSVGFWLSVGATAGVTTLAPWLSARLRRLGPLGPPLAVTVGAQIGVLVPSVLVFGRLSMVSTVANLAAVPVAGFVMLYGLPASIVAGAVPLIRWPVMLPVQVGVWWVDRVARWAAAVEDRGPLVATGVVVIALGVVAVTVSALGRLTPSRSVDHVEQWPAHGRARPHR